MRRYPTLLFVILGGCATSPGDSETNREVVLKYLDADVGTAGPFSKHAKRELEVLSDKDRAEVSALLERGGVGFEIFAPANRPERGTVARIVIVLKGKIAGDFPAARKAATP